MINAIRKAMPPFLAAGALCGAAGPALSQSEPVITPPVVTSPAIDLGTLRSIQRSEQFRLRQQLDREQDRRDAMQPMPQPRVPVMVPTCSPANRGRCR